VTCFGPWNMVEVLSSILLLAFLESCPTAIWTSSANLLEDERPCEQRWVFPAQVILD
jgi:hypothetical protein